MTLLSSFTSIGLAKCAATFFGVLEVVMGVRAILWPSKYATFHGVIDLKAYSRPRPSSYVNPFIPITGGQHIASGFSLIIFAYLNEEKSIGVCMTTALITGVVDGWVVLNNLPLVNESETVEEKARQYKLVATAKQAGWAHCIAGGISAMVGTYLLAVD